jgi:hypothetical protein
MLTYGEWARQQGVSFRQSRTNPGRGPKSRDLYGEYQQYVEQQRQAEEAEAARQRAAAEQQRQAAEAARQQAEAERRASEERLRLTTEQAAQDENKRNANDPNNAELRGLGFNANQGEGDGGGSAMTELTGLGGVGPDNMRLSRRRLLGGR